MPKEFILVIDFSKLGFFHGSEIYSILGVCGGTFGVKKGRHKRLLHLSSASLMATPKTIVLSHRCQWLLRLQRRQVNL